MSGLQQLEAEWPTLRQRKQRPLHSVKEGDGGNLRVVGLWGEVKDWVEVGVLGELGLEEGCEDLSEPPELEPLSDAAEADATT